MRTAKVILATVLVLAWTATAAAECAWVLWTKTVRGRGPIGWEIQSSYVEQPSCTERRDAILKTTAQSWSGRLGDEKVRLDDDEKMLRLFFANDVWAIYYVCLPDTLDPREKKE